MKNLTPIALLLAVAALLIGLLLGYGCDRKPDPEQPPVSQQIKTGTAAVRNDVKALEATERPLQAKYDSLSALLKAAYASDKKQHQNKRNTDLQAEAKYKAGVLPCDSVIAAKNATIQAGIRAIAKADSLQVVDSLNTASFKREIEGKDVALTQLSDLNDKAVKELERLEKKAGRKWGIGIQAGYGITPAGLQPQIGIGVQRNLIRF